MTWANTVQLIQLARSDPASGGASAYILHTPVAAVIRRPQTARADRKHQCRVQRAHRLLHSRSNENVQRDRPGPPPRRHPRHRLPHQRHPDPGMDEPRHLPHSHRSLGHRDASPQPGSTTSTTTPAMRLAMSSICSLPTSLTTGRSREHQQGEHTRSTEERVAANQRHRRPRLGDTTDPTPRLVLDRDVHRRTRRPAPGACRTPRRADHADPDTAAFETAIQRHVHSCGSRSRPFAPPAA